MEKVYKLIKQKVVISPNIRSVVDLKAEVYSQDIDVTKIVVELESANDELIDLTDATVTVGLKVNNVTIEDVGQVEDVSNRLISYCPGERFKINEGTVTLGFFVTLNTGQRIDIQNYKINFKRSLIDTATEEEVKPYFTSLDTIVSELKEHATNKQYEVDDSVNHAKTEIEAKVNTVETAKTTAVEQIGSYLENSKTAMDGVVSDVQSTGETQKEAINSVVSDVQSTGDTAKTQISQVLPDVQSKVLAINTELAKIDENMPDLYVAYADNINGGGFSKTDSSKLYKGYGVKNSNLATDYRWERNVDSLQIGGRNILRGTKDMKLGSGKWADGTWRQSSTGTTKNVALTDFPLSNITQGIEITSDSSVCGVTQDTLKLESGYYTLSYYVKAKAPNTTVNIEAFWNSKNSGFSKDVVLKDTNWTRISITCELKESQDTIAAGFIYVRTPNSTITVAAPFEHRSSKEADWTPAPEDQVSQVELDELKSYIGYTDTDVYGVEVDMVNKTFKRLAGSIGKNTGADFDNINAFKRRRCNVTDTGVVLSYYGDSNYTESGLTTAEITKNSVNYPINTPVQVMVEQPKFYYKVVPLSLEPIANGKGYHMRKGRYYISDYPKAGFKVHPAFVRNGVEHDKIYLSAYEGSIFDKSESAYLLDDEQVADFSTDKLSSISNAKPCSGLTQNLTRANARLLAHNRGVGWEQQTIQTVSLTQLLFLIEYNMFNMQTAIGMGAVNKTDDGSTNMAENTGGTSSLGNASGAVTNTNGIQFVSYRGEENPFGNIWKFVDGINVMAKGIHSAYIADHDFNDKQSTGSYADVGFTLAKTSGYVSAFGYSQDFDWLFLTSETAGNSIVPVGDHFWQNYTATDDGGWRTVQLGAAWHYNSNAGGFRWDVYYSSVTRYLDLSGRLVYVGG